jgi:hypothetical protein
VLGQVSQFGPTLYPPSRVNALLASLCPSSPPRSSRPAQVFGTGFSNGGMMANRAGCQAAELFAGVAPVAGNIRYGNGWNRRGLRRHSTLSLSVQSCRDSPYKRK